MNRILTKRDIAVLVDVYKFRYLSAAQVEALHFPSQRTAYRRLQTLRDGKYLKAFTVQGVSGRMFHLDTYGAAVVAQSMEVDIDDLQWTREMRAPKDYYFLRHFMAINDFRIALTLACQNTAINLLGFIPEYIGEKTEKGNVKKYLRDNVNDITDSLKQISHTPDAAFALEKMEMRPYFLSKLIGGVETISDPQKGVLKSIVFYLNYWIAGKFNRYEQDFQREFTSFRSLLVINSPKRLQNIRSAVTKFPFPKTQVKRFLWGTTDINKGTIFSPVWQSLDANDETAIKSVEWRGRL